MRRVWIGLVCMALLSIWTDASYPMTGEEVVKKVRKRYEKLKRFSAEFEQTFEWKLAEEMHRFKGKLYLKKPNRFRLETETQTVVSDGKQVWTYVYANKQVILTSYSDMKGMPKWEDLLFEYREQYRTQYIALKKLGDKEYHLVELVPKEEDKDADVVEMKVWVDPKRWVVLKAAYVDLNGDVTTYRLSKVAVDPKMDDALFAFQVPEGVDVVDMREPR